MDGTRYALELLDRSEDEVRFTLTLPTGSPLFAGHFPDNPILPGVAQVQICTEALASVLGRRVDTEQVEVVRFRQPIRPDTPCTLTIHMPDEARRVRFSLGGEKGVIADGRLVLTEECARG